MRTQSIITKLQKDADKIVAKVQRRIIEQGAYENAGQSEIRRYLDKLPTNLHYQDQCHLSDYINRGIDNLRY